MQILSRRDTEVARYAKAILANGLEVIVCSRPATRSFAWGLSVKAGARDGKPHLAHLVEHLSLGDLSKFSSHSEFANAFTRFSKTDYLMSGHQNDQRFGLKVLQTIFNPLDVTEERVRDECEILRREQIETGFVNLQLQRAHLRVLGGDALGKSNKVELKKRPRLTAADCNEFHRRHYHPANATLCLVCPDSIDDALAQIEESLGGLASATNANNANAPLQRVQPKHRSRLNTLFYRYSCVTCAVWHDLPNPDLEQRLALKMMQEILGGFGKLFEAIRSANQLAYGVYLEDVNDPERFCQLIVTNLGARRVQKAVRLVSEEIVKACQPQSREEFDRHLQSRLQTYDLLEEKPLDLAVSLLGWNSVSPRELLTPKQLKEALAGLTPAKLAETAAKLFDSANRHVYLAGPFGPLSWRSAKRFAAGK